MKKKPSNGAEKAIGLSSLQVPSVTTSQNLLNERWLDKQDILQQLHISDRTLQRWRSENLLPFSRINGKIYYRQSALHALLLGKEEGGA